LSSRDAEVIVAGAGPAGAAAAAHLRGAGIDVLVLERGRFPRDKVCGDFVGPVALDELRLLGIGDLPAIAQANACDRAALFADGRELITYRLPQRDGLPSYGRVVPRVVFDEALAQAARSRGARLEEGLTVSGFERDGDGVEVSVRDGNTRRRLRARALIAADGAGSQIARALHGAARRRDEFLVAARGYFEGVDGPEGRCDLSFTSDSFPGYAWIFPTGAGQANVGVGMVVETFPETSENMHELLAALIQRDPAMRARLASARICGNVMGWPLATYGGRTSVVGDGVALIGDAAGLVNPLNGEGIQAALCSARWAAETVVRALRHDDVSRAGLAPYALRLQRELGLDMLLARLIVRVIANRALNPLWLPMLRAIVGKASSDERYARATGGVVAGIVPVREAFRGKMLRATAVATLCELQHVNVRDAAGSLVEMLRRPSGTLRWARGVAEVVALAFAARKDEKKSRARARLVGSAKAES
jgi:menaquinone-9 beta-reductase